MYVGGKGENLVNKTKTPQLKILTKNLESEVLVAES